MRSELTSWKYLFGYKGRHPGYCELDDPPHPVYVGVYGQGNKRKAISKASGEVEFEYKVYPENCNWGLGRKGKQ